MTDKTSIIHLMLVPVVFLLWFAAIFDPVGSLYGLRYLALGLALLMALTVGLPLMYGRASRAFGLREVMLFLSLLLLPTYGLLVYSWRGAGGPFDDTSYVAAGILLATTWLFVDARACDIGIRIAVLCLRFFAVVIVVTYLVGAASPDAPLLAFFAEGNVALFGFREYGPLTLPYIYFLASPLLIFLLAHETQAVTNQVTTVRVLACLVATLALGLSGTRAHQLIAALYVPVCLLLARRTGIHALAVTIGAVLLVTVLIAGSNIFGYFFDVQEANNSMKLEALDRYGDIFADPITLMLGQGFNAHEWSEPLKQMIAVENGATKTELTYLELFRVFGIVGAVPYIALLLIIVYRSTRLPSHYAWLCPALVVMLMNSALNPYLFSTNGMLPMALVLALIAHQGAVNQGVRRTDARRLTVVDRPNHHSMTPADGLRT